VNKNRTTVDGTRKGGYCDALQLEASDAAPVVPGYFWICNAHVHRHTQALYQNSDVAIRFSDPIFLKENNNLAIRQCFQLFFYSTDKKYQMYFEGSVVGKASTIRERSRPPSPNFHRGGGQNMRNLASFKTSFKFEPPAFENAARFWHSETKVQCCDDRPMSWPSLVKLGPRTTEKALSVVPHPLKLHAKTC